MTSQIKERIEPWMDLPEKNLKKVSAIADAMHKATDNMEYNLATDTLKVPGQNWACVSFVSPDGNQKCGSIGMKIRGVFDQQSEAVAHVKRLIKLDPTFDIFVCDMYNWCLVPPDPEKVNDQTYQDETLNSIISEYRKNQIYAKEHFEERKREMMEQAADEAKAAVLKKMETVAEEPEPEPSNLSDSVGSTFGGSQETVSASSIMESMVNREKWADICC
jgi:hypothetical protein